MSEEFNYSEIELELQVRLMSLVMGEASDFERDQLQLMMEQRPELATYFQHIEHLHGLLCEVGAGDPSIELDSSTAEDAWQLSADRREKVLAVLDHQSPDPPVKVTLANKSESKHWRKRLLEVVAVASIACILIGLILQRFQSDRLLAVKSSVNVNSLRSDEGRAFDYLFSDDNSFAPAQAAAKPQPNAASKSVPSTLGGTTSTYEHFAAGSSDDVASAPRRMSYSSENTTSAPTILKTPDKQSADNGRERNEEPTLMMTVTPRIIVPLEQGKELSELSMRYRKTPSEDGVRQWSDSDGDKKAGDVAGKSEPLNQLAPSWEYSRGSGAPSNGLRSSVDSSRTSELANPERLNKSLQTLQGSDKAKVDSESDYLKYYTTVDGEILDTIAAYQPVSIDEQSASTEAFSTFSLHVSDVSFKLAQSALSQGQWPDVSQIRIEEFVNALDYHDPLPRGNEKVACRVEQAVHPFLIQRNLLRVSMRTAATGRSQNTPLRLTLLLDNSGSMERPDRRQAVLRAFQTLTQQLNASDQVTLIGFANKPRLLADKVPGNQGESLLQLIENLPSEGGTNIESALLLAHEKAMEQRLAGAQNRIVLLTDGAVNLGDANPKSLSRLVTQIRDSGIAFDAAGISAQDLNDQVLEALTRQGDGRYYLLGSADAVGESFASQVAGALRPSAQNVKVQVEFNPQRVGRYKLLGFEKHRLNQEDFRNDQVDAAEMAAAEAGVAIYQFEINPLGSGDVGNVSVRFRDLSTGQMVERRWPIPYEANVPRLEHADPSIQLAAVAAMFAAKLAGGPLADSVDLVQLRNLCATLPEKVASQPRVQQLLAMIDQAKAIGR